MIKLETNGETEIIFSREENFKYSIITVGVIIIICSLLLMITGNIGFRHIPILTALWIVATIFLFITVEIDSINKGERKREKKYFEEQLKP